MHTIREQVRKRRFGERLKAARIARGLTQLEAAEMLDTTQANISQYETGRFSPSAIWVIHAIKTLNLDPKIVFSDLFPGPKPPGRGC